MAVNVRKHLPKFTLAIGVALLVLGSMFGPAQKTQASSFKVLVIHRGQPLCVNAMTLPSHLDHGDTTDFQVCY